MLHAPADTKPVLVRLDLKVQTYDIDFARHVNNQVYVRWLEDLRMELLRAHYPLEQCINEDIAPVLAATHITYQRAITILDRPWAHMWVTSMSQASFLLEAEFFVDDRRCAHATQRGAFLNLATGRPIRVPAKLSALFKQEAGLA